MGEFKEDTIDRDAFEDFVPTTHEIDAMQQAVALRYCREASEKIEKMVERVKYYKEKITLEQLEELNEILVDLERTLE